MDRQCKYRALISAFIDNELPSDKTAEVQSHLETCRDCRAEWETLVNTDESLQTLEEIEPAHDFETKFWKKVSDIEDKKSHWSFLNLLLSGWRPYAATAAVLVGVIALILSYRSPVYSPEDMIIADHLEFFQDLEIIDRLDFLENIDIIVMLEEKS